MHKIGVITHFHNSINYGGVLQAYALCAALKECGIQAEQICYVPYYPETEQERKPFLKRIVNVFRPAMLQDYILSRLDAMHNDRIALHMQKRRQAFATFGAEHVPQSKAVYRGDDMRAAGEDYDCFVTGSDQVWNLDWYQGAYFLDFVPEGKKKISYAASLGMYSLTEEQKQTFRNLLADYTAVSVREEDAVELLQPISPVEVNCTLDPTMLLSAAQWDEICAEKLVQEPYLFCYFLGENQQLRHMAAEYARSHGLKIVTIPHAKGSHTKDDERFGDEQVWAASPVEFLSLIKHADCIFTNSFHAVVFSGIYEKEYFVFPRRKGDRMVSRIYTLTGYYGSRDHFCDTEERHTLHYINSVSPISYCQVSEILQERKAESIAYLQMHLTDME